MFAFYPSYPAQFTPYYQANYNPYFQQNYPPFYQPYYQSNSCGCQNITYRQEPMVTIKKSIVPSKKKVNRKYASDPIQKKATEVEASEVNIERAKSQMNLAYERWNHFHHHFSGIKEIPRWSIKEQVRIIGVVPTDPSKYEQLFSGQLVKSEDLPNFVKEIPTPEGIILAADYKRPAVPELEGDVEALAILVDLQKEGLLEYKSQLDEYLKLVHIMKLIEKADKEVIGEEEKEEVFGYKFL